MSGLRVAVFSGTALILAIALVRALGGRYLPKALFPALWCAAAVRLLLPFALPTAFSVWNLLPQSAAVSVPAQQISLTAAAAPAAAAVQQAAAPSVVQAVNVPLYIWAIGTVLLAAYYLLGYCRALRRFSSAKPIQTDGFSMELPRRVRLRVTDDARAPLTYGVLRPVILLPAQGMESADVRRAVLAHELAHVRRFDCLRKLLLTVCLCVHWWNPACWMMVYLANRDIELASDALALRTLGVSFRKRYALALLTLAAQQTRPYPLCAGFGRPAAEARIRAVLRARRVPVWLTLLAAVLAGMLVTALATQAAPRPERREAFAGKPAPVQAPAEEPAQTQEPVIAVQSAPEPESEPEPEPLPGEPTTQFAFPLENTAAPVTDAYGYKKHPLTGKEAFHPGVDLAEDAGREIYAIGAGTVTTAAYDDAWGYYVVIDHGDGYQSLYAHLPSLTVAAGQAVGQGDVIGTVGATGWVTDAHLHLSIYENGEAVDPLAVLGMA